MRMVIDASNVGGAAGLFNAFARNSTSTRIVLIEIAELIAERNEKAWGKYGAKLADATLESKAQKGQSLEPLVGATGDMKEDLTNAARGILSVSDTELIFGTRQWYARFAQYGTLHEPKRRPLRFTPLTRRLAAGLILKHITKGE